jgi:hypothetical protein
MRVVKIAAILLTGLPPGGRKCLRSDHPHRSPHSAYDW